MITTEWIGDRLVFDASGHRAYIEVSQWCVSILACDHLSYDAEPASIEPDEAVAVLRAMLRELAGPSIDDVRDVWGAKTGHVHVRHPSTRDGLYDVQVWDGDRDRSFMSQTLREALQEAYDAGVARRGGADA